MANIKSAIKRIHKNNRQAEENLAHRTKVKSFVKKAITAIESNDVTIIPEALKATIKVIDTVAGKGVIHKNKAARLKSRLTLKANKAGTTEAVSGAPVKKKAATKKTATKKAAASKAKAIIAKKA